MRAPHMLKPRSKSKMVQCRSTEKWFGIVIEIILHQGFSYVCVCVCAQSKNVFILLLQCIFFHYIVLLTLILCAFKKDANNKNEEE